MSNHDLCEPFGKPDLATWTWCLSDIRCKQYHVIYPPGYADVRLYSRGLSCAARLPEVHVHLLTLSERYISEPIVILCAAMRSGSRPDTQDDDILQIAAWQRDKLCSLVEKDMNRRVAAVSKAANKVEFLGSYGSPLKNRTKFGLIISRYEGVNETAGAKLLVERLRLYIAYIGAEAKSAALLRRLDQSVEILQEGLNRIIAVYESQGSGSHHAPGPDDASTDDHTSEFTDSEAELEHLAEIQHRKRVQLSKGH